MKARYPFDLDSEDYENTEFVDNKGQKYYMWERVRPFSEEEINLIKEEEEEFDKNALKVNILSTDSPETITNEIEIAIGKYEK